MPREEEDDCVGTERTADEHAEEVDKYSSKPFAEALVQATLVFGRS